MIYPTMIHSGSTPFEFFANLQCPTYFVCVSYLFWGVRLGDKATKRLTLQRRFRISGVQQQPLA